VSRFGGSLAPTAAVNSAPVTDEAANPGTTSDSSPKMESSTPMLGASMNHYGPSTTLGGALLHFPKARARCLPFASIARPLDSIPCACQVLGRLRSVWCQQVPTTPHKLVLCSLPVTHHRTRLISRCEYRSIQISPHYPRHLALFWNLICSCWARRGFESCKFDVHRE
jgi:hypothetical protein